MEGLRLLLEKMASVLPFSELATDASSSIMKLVRDLKGMLMLSPLPHQLKSQGGQTQFLSTYGLIHHYSYTISVWTPGFCKRQGQP